MDENNKKIDKIYTRNRIKMPNLKRYFISQNIKKQRISQKKIRKLIKIIMILLVAFMVADIIIKAIEPIIDKQCINMAKAIATKVSNEQSTKAMVNYKYDDLTNIIKDEEGNIKMISANIVTVNKIISDIPILIQNEFDKPQNSKFYIKLGTFTGTKLFSGRGPNIEIKISTIGNIETDLKSEFSEAGINQTIHRIYLEIRCNVIILTPFNSVEEQIINQVLLAEGLIVGNIPNTYYNLEGLNKDNFVDVIE